MVEQQPSLDISTSDPASSIAPDLPPLQPLAICPLAIATFAYDVEAYNQHLFALGCRKWACNICGPRKRQILIRRITKASPTKFVTLSCLHVDGPENQLKTLTKALPKLIKKIRTHIGAIEYLRALEYCNDGYPHYHLLARVKFIEQKWLSEQWAALTGARVVDIRKAHGRSTKYVAKYMSKATGTENTWIRQQFAVSKNFWQDQDATTQWLNWETNRIPVYEAAANICQVNTLERVGLGCYRIEPGRTDGDDVPYELNPAWWSDIAIDD